VAKWSPISATAQHLLVQLWHCEMVWKSCR